jgi:hypothetical protein
VNELCAASDLNNAHIGKQTAITSIKTTADANAFWEAGSGRTTAVSSVVGMSRVSNQ